MKAQRLPRGTNLDESSFESQPRVLESHISDKTTTNEKMEQKLGMVLSSIVLSQTHAELPSDGYSRDVRQIS